MTATQLDQIKAKYEERQKMRERELAIYDIPAPMVTDENNEELFNLYQELDKLWTDKTVGLLLDENQRLRDAVAFYADDASYTVRYDTEHDRHYTLVERDSGQRAQQALESEPHS